MSKLKFKVYFIVLVMIITLVGCGKKENSENEIEVYYNESTVQQIDFIKEIAVNFEKKEHIKVKFIGVKDEELIKEKIDDQKDSQIVILDGYAFYDFVENDYLRDLSYLFKEKDTRNKFSIITNIYGREEGRYWGVATMPFSLDLVLNRDYLESRGIEIKSESISDAILELRKNGIKIHSYIKSEYSKELLLSALVANDTIIYDLNDNEITSSIKGKITNIKNGQKMFDKIYDFYQLGSFREENFIDVGPEIIKEFNEEKIPAFLTTTLVANELDPKVKSILINRLPIENQFVNAPVGVDVIFTASVGIKNIDNTDSFLRYLLQGNGFEPLGKYKVVTGNKFSDSGLVGIQGKMVSSINAADQINKLYFNIISNPDIWSINKEIVNVMNGQYDGNEWNRILEESKAKKSNA